MNTTEDTTPAEYAQHHLTVGLRCAAARDAEAVLTSHDAASHAAASAELDRTCRRIATLTGDRADRVRAAAIAVATQFAATR